jgi:hypothetical protein
MISSVVIVISGVSLSFYDKMRTNIRLISNHRIVLYNCRSSLDESVSRDSYEISWQQL